MRTPLAFACLLLSAVVAAAAPAAKPAYESDPAFVKQKQEAERLSKQRGSEVFVADAWRKANKIAQGKCMECYVDTIHALLRTGDNKGAVKEAVAMEAAADTPVEKSDALFQQGKVLLFAAGNDKPKAALLEQAHDALSKACTIDPTDKNAAFLDGTVLARLSRDAEATAAFQKYTAQSKPTDPLFLRAQHFADDPELARHKTAPPVMVTTLAGKHFNLDDMHGRVVLIDFWATWCGPCNQELPHMQKLAKKYAEDPFEIVSISWDADEGKWKDFVAAHNMTWNQYRDSDHQLSKIFGVDAIPHYFTIDSDGVLTAENIGSGSMADGRIDKLVQRAREAQRNQRETATANTPGLLSHAQ